ncbi:MAG: hypothetical protein V2A62_04110 [Candidatus Woesearchaeota archaeon]
MPYKEVDAEPVLSRPMRVKYKDVFELKAFYEAMHEWLMHYGWTDVDDKADHWETAYIERIDRNGNREIHFNWRTFKPAEGGPFNYYLDLNFHVLGLSNVEVVKDGIKLKVQKGEIEMHYQALVEKTYEKDLKKNKLISPFLNLFNKRVYRQEYEERKKELYQELYMMQNFIKQWFKLKRYLPYEESKTLFISQAWPSHLKE